MEDTGTKGEGDKKRGVEGSHRSRERMGKKDPEEASGRALGGWGRHLDLPGPEREKHPARTPPLSGGHSDLPLAGRSGVSQGCLMRVTKYPEE